MSESILISTKKILGLAEDYTAFDLDIVMFINSVLADLNQLGVGPDEGFMITGADEEWADLLGSDLRANRVKTYIYLRVRKLFDPPQTSFHIAAMDEQIREHEWRMNVHRETTEWVDPDPDPIPAVVPVVPDEWEIDGGGPS